MTEKRFEVVMNEFDEVEYIMDKVAMEDRDFAEFIDFIEGICNENEQLKSDNKEYIKGLDLAKATSQSWASDVRELREENCRLEKKNERLMKKIKRERASTTKQHLKWSDEAEEIINELKKENEQLKKEKEYWKSDACSQSNYLSILSMDCSIVEEAIFNLKNVIDVDTEAYNLLDELSDKFDELQEHRINWGYSLSEEEKQDVIKYLRAYND